MKKTFKDRAVLGREKFFLLYELKPRVFVECTPGNSLLAEVSHATFLTLQELAKREYTHLLVSVGFIKPSNAVAARPVVKQADGE